MVIKGRIERRDFGEVSPQSNNVNAPGMGRLASRQPQPPWRLLTDAKTLQVDLPASSTAQRRLCEEIRALPTGTRIIVCSNAMGSRWRCRRFAAAAGITLLREYVAIPSAQAPTYYVEDTPQALRYFFSHVLALPFGGAATSAAFAAAKAAAGFVFPAALPGAVAPARIVLGRTATTPGKADGSNQSTELLDASGMQAVVLALSKDPNGKLTVLLIPRTTDLPKVAVKVPMTDAAQASIAAERHVLSELRAHLPGTVLVTVPALADLPEARGRPFLVTTALPGVPMSTRYHAWRHLATPAAVKADFMAVERWLSRFQAFSTGSATPMDMDGGLVPVLRRRFAQEPNLNQALGRLAAIHGRLRKSRTPRTAVNGDFWFGNLLWAGHEISGVLDWEAGTIRGEPVRDLVRFALTYALYLDRHSKSGRHVAGHPGLRAGVWGSGIEYAVDGEGWFPALFRTFLSDGLIRLGADPTRWRDLAVAGLAEVAATADHVDFASLHWQLFNRLAIAGSPTR